MPFFDAITKRFALRIGLPAILIMLATFAIVVVSLAKMAGHVNRIEGELTARSATAAVQSVLRHLGETDNDYAQWDDAVRNLYGAVNRDWAAENVATSTLFDTIYLIDESGNGILSYRNGELVSATPAAAFGPALASMVAALPKDGKTYDVQTGVVRGAWGLATVAVGPIVPASANYPNLPQRLRYLVMGKAFDDAAVNRVSEDFVIDGLRLVDPAASEPLKVDLVDPNGTVVGALGWSPGQLGSQASAQVSPAALAMLLLVGLTMAFLMLFALRGWKEVKKGELRLDAALNNMAHGLCMFDADGKLVIFNPRFAEIYGLPVREIAPGMTTRQLMALAFGSGRFSDVDPEGSIALQQSFVREHKPGSLVEHLTDGRSIAISHQPTPDEGFVATFEDITERLLTEEKVKHLARHDTLTDLLNRVAFYEQMETVLSRLRRSETMAVLSLDLDHFKSVNDTLGHPIGDLLLQTAAERMLSCVRGEDIVARLGGDEFAIVQVPSELPSSIVSLATRLIDVVGAPYDLDGHQVIVGISVGITVAPGEGSEPDALMKNADLALYRAKADGGGIYRFFEVGMDARMQARRILELDLRKAIVNREFELFYQPIVDVKTGAVTSCEALIRWNHPERGMVAPMDFIPIAEETGLIVPLAEWVLRRACTEAARWPKHVTVAVNLSPAQFKSRNLVPTVISALATSGLSAGRLELEITELVLMQQNEGAIATLHQLRNLGIRIAMDDFGTGYSSLGYLRSFPFDRIKIDQSFIRDLPGKEDSLAIVRAVVGLSSSLGIKTTAEGVETTEQLASLTSEGCNEFQGFLFSQPRPAAEVERLLGEDASQTAAVA
jgi:diguanylate cyclase (GGDEF)-like protein/PAS domain S-box-containing protein